MSDLLYPNFHPKILLSGKSLKEGKVRGWLPITETSLCCHILSVGKCGVVYRSKMLVRRDTILLSSALCPLPSALCHLPSVLCLLPYYLLPSTTLCHLHSVILLPSIYPQSSVVYLHSYTPPLLHGKKKGRKEGERRKKKGRKKERKKERKEGKKKGRKEKEERKRPKLRDLSLLTPVSPLSGGYLLSHRNSTIGVIGLNCSVRYG
ncbi:MAG: hypothetical protein SOW44_01050 [Porphyromonas sp.]|nr:hypothetical protein [Porphyromonas sp.]